MTAVAAYPYPQSDMRFAVYRNKAIPPAPVRFIPQTHFANFRYQPTTYPMHPAQPYQFVYVHPQYAQYPHPQFAAAAVTPTTATTTTATRFQPQFHPQPFPAQPTPHVFRADEPGYLQPAPQPAPEQVPEPEPVQEPQQQEDQVGANTTDL